MVKERLRAIGLPCLLAIVAALVAAGPAPGEDARPIRLTDAAERGLFNVGASRGDVSVAPDPAAGEVLKLDYTIPEGTAVGVWAKGLPEGMRAETVDLVRPSVRSDDPEAARLVAVRLEIKGKSGLQSLPLPLGGAWVPSEHLLDWKAIGSPTEIVVSLSRQGTGAAATGTIYLDIRFERLSPLRRLALSPLARLGGIFLLALAGAALATALRLSAARWPQEAGGTNVGAEPGPPAWLGGIGRDIVLGVGAVAVAWLAAGIYEVGALGGLEAGWSCAGPAVAGLALTSWFRYGLTGRFLSGREVFQDFLAIGALAASSSPLPILKTAADWSEMLLLSQPVAAVVALLYLAFVASRLATTGKHPGPVAAAMIVGAPYAVGWLLLLEPGGIVRSLGDLLTAGTLASQPALAEFAGRLVVLFGFNEIAANAIGLASRRTLLRSARAHLWLLGVAAFAVAGPWVAGYGSGEIVAALPGPVRLVNVVAWTVLSQAGLWAEVYLLTGMVLDAIRGVAPTLGSASAHPVEGMKKAIIYSGTFLGGLNLLAILAGLPGVRRLALDAPLFLGALSGAAVFPLVKTIVETFDGSQGFFRRVGKSYRSPVLYLRGAVVGLGLGWGFGRGLSGSEMLDRVAFGFGVGVTAFAGVNLLRDAIAARAGRGSVQSWRVYLVQGMLGGAIGAAIGFYLDAVQVAVIVEKFHRYVDPGQAPVAYEAYPLLSKWGFLRLGQVSGGPSLLFAEALEGVISWSIPSWLFAINRTFMAAYFDRESSPIRSLFTRAGFAQLGENMLGVLRWGLWMSPIIKSFLRPMGQPTWYNQDGAIHTALSIVHDATSTAEAFRSWSLGVFIALLAHDWVRILIWVDHMGLRVATLVNLSFLGMDRLDRRLSRFLAPAATARCIPEGVKRFTTWAPLLIPFYIPRGKDWDTAWSRAEAIRAGEHGGVLAALAAWPAWGQAGLFVGSAVATTAAFAAARRLRDRARSGRRPALTLGNPVYEVTIDGDGAVFSRDKVRDYDVSRRSYDRVDPAGRTIFLVDPAGGPGPIAVPLIGNVPAELAELPTITRGRDSLRVVRATRGLRATIEITLPDADDSAELWSITLENPADAARRVEVIPYLEWVLNRQDADRGHTQYNRLFAEIEYARGLNAVLAWDKHSKAMGVLASDVTPAGFLSSRMDFIGRGRSLWSPRIVETLAFTEPRDTDAHPTFDPIGALRLGVDLPPRGSSHVRLLIGLVADKRRAIDLVARHLGVPLAEAVPPDRRRRAEHSIGHGEVPPGTPIPCTDFSEDGRMMLVRTPFTTRPFDHTMSNALGHVAVVTNRGLHTSSSVNAQQNRLTPEWSDTVTKEVPSEAFYLYDLDSREWFSPTYHPRNDVDAAHESEFGVDGTAVFRMGKGALETELTVFVPPDDPGGLYRLTIRNRASVTRRLRVAPYFQIVLASQPEHAGPLEVRRDESLDAVFFENPRNTFRTGPAFVAVASGARVRAVETDRGRFFGEGRSLAHPAFVDGDSPDPGPTADNRPVAAFLAEIEVPAGGEHTLVVVLGQADDRATAEAVIRKYRDPSAASDALDQTRRWWSGLMDTLAVRTGEPEFDRYLDWLKYQALAERIWARRGFYQASGAYGFRDQLQDAVNLIWMDPALARGQILLHASQQFLEGDVVHWFHLLQDGRTGFSGRTHASDNLLWLGWAVVEYVGATGDESILRERTPYLESDLPFEPLPRGKGGMGFDPLRSSRDDTVYRHCLKAIDLVLDRRMGAHGLPLMGTGDWNDGLDEIGSEGRGESVWLGFFLHYILSRMVGIIARIEGRDRGGYYERRLGALTDAIEATWRGDRYLRAFHDDGTEIGVKGSGIWEIDALTAAWAVMSGINPSRGRVVFETALDTLERDKTILLGWPPLREDTKPYLGRSSGYPEGVRENGMYCHGVQWLVGAARILAEEAGREGRPDEARRYVETAGRLWRKIAAIPHAVAGEVETYGGQPNQQAADMVTTFDPGRMIWNGYTGAAGWMFRQALEGVLGLRLVRGEVQVPEILDTTAGDAPTIRVARDLSATPLQGPPALRLPAQSVEVEHSAHPI